MGGPVSTGVPMLPALLFLAALPAPERILIPSDHAGSQLSLLHVRASAPSAPPVLFLHGATFPSPLAAGYRFDGRSWMDELATAGFDVWALDFLRHGDSGRYLEMSEPADAHPPLGRAVDGARQIARALDFIHKRRGPGFSLVADSWGTLAAGVYSAERGTSSPRTTR